MINNYLFDVFILLPLSLSEESLLYTFLFMFLVLKWSSRVLKVSRIPLKFKYNRPTNLDDTLELPKTSPQTVTLLTSEKCRDSRVRLEPTDGCAVIDRGGGGGRWKSLVDACDLSREVHPIETPPTRRL